MTTVKPFETASTKNATPKRQISQKNRKQSKSRKRSWSSLSMEYGAIIAIAIASASILITADAWSTPRLNLPPFPSPILHATCSCSKEDKSEQTSITNTITKTFLTLTTITSLTLSNPPPSHASNDATPPESSRTYLSPSQKRYIAIQSSGTPEEIASANEALLDHAVGTINTMYYDSTGGNNFDTRTMYSRWGALKAYGKNGEEGLERWKKSERKRIERERADWVDVNANASDDDDDDNNNNKNSALIKAQNEAAADPNKLYPELATLPKETFASRENAVKGMNWLVSTLADPYSKYLTKEELVMELKESTTRGLLGCGAFVEAPQDAPDTLQLRLVQGGGSDEEITQKELATKNRKLKKKAEVEIPAKLSIAQVSDLPIVTAVTPDSQAERDGIVVGDRIVAVGKESFLGLDRNEVSQLLNKYNSNSKDVSNGSSSRSVVVAKAVLGVSNTEDEQQEDNGASERLLGYRVSKLNFKVGDAASTTAEGSSQLLVANENKDSKAGPSVAQGGDYIVHYKLLQPSDSLFRKMSFSFSDGDDNNEAVSTSNSGPVGYIRLTRFSKAATTRYINAINELEKAGAQSYILDVRNNYGGIVQEAMLTASTLLRDPHSALCYTLNARGGFTGHDVEEYLTDPRFPGYLLSSESPTVSLEQGIKDDPEYFKDEKVSKWTPPSAYASLHQQNVQRKINRGTTGVSDESIRAQKKIVLLMNEGTASSAEVFAAALHDNGRLVATIGSKTYGKGLILHTFPMPDGGGLRIAVAEYLTPSLKHVTSVGGARYNANGDLVGGGIYPDIQCSSNQGIPSDIGADICVGVALDALDAANDE